MSREQLPAGTRRVIEEIRAADPPDDLLHTVIAEAESTPQVRGPIAPWLTALTAVGVGVAVITMAFVVVPLLDGLQRTGGPSPDISIGPDATPIHALPVDVTTLPIAGIVDTQMQVQDGAYPASADDASLWLGNEATGQVLRVDLASGEVIGSVPVNGAGGEYNLWPISDGTSVWTSGVDDGSLVRIDIGSMSVAERFAIQAIPYRIAPAGSVVWLTDYGDNEVLKLDAATGEVLLTIELERPTGIAVTATDVWVATYTGVLGRIDPRSGRVVSTSIIAPRATDLQLVDDQLWITGINGRRLERYDVANGAVAAWTGAVTAVAFIDGRPWAAVSAGALVRLETDTLEWTAAVPLEGELDQLVAADGRLWAFAATPDETRLYVVRPTQ